MAVEDDPFGMSDDDGEVRIVEPGGEEIALTESEELAPLGETAEQRETRLERRKARKTLLDQIAEKDKKIEELSNQFQGFQQNFQGFTQSLQQRQQPGPDPLQAELQSLAAYEDRHRKAGWAEQEMAKQEQRQLDPEFKRNWENEQRAIENRRQQINARIAMREAGVAPAASTRREIVMERFKDITGDPRTNNYFVGQWHTLTAGEGHDESEQTLELAAQRTREFFKMQRQGGGKVTDGERAKLSNIRGSNAPSGGSGNTVEMTPELKKLAEAKYQDRPDLTAKQKWVLWAQKHGKAFRRNLAERENRG